MNTHLRPQWVRWGSGRVWHRQEVVHHEDENPMDDDPENLRVFASEAEHQRHHGRLRGGLNRGRSRA